jgi:hypothetical protein
VESTETQTRGEAVAAFLADPATHGGAEVEVITTHSAQVFLAGDRAYKIKRPVRYAYLDFTAPEERRRVLERELELNAPAAPQIYERVCPVTRDADGRLALDGPGAPVDHVLIMRRFPREAELVRVAEAGQFTEAMAQDLGRAVAAYHARAERRAEDGAALVAEILDELSEAFATMRDALGADRIARFDRAARQAHARLAPLLRGRGAAGAVRRGHGDLHLGNIVLVDGAPVLFDALEFDERLGTCDILYDLAFLAMDLDRRGLAPQAHRVFQTWLDAMRDEGGLAALPLFLAMRAAIRAMVAVQGDGPTDPARAMLDQAARYLDPPAPRLFAVGGVSGTGKSELARRLAPALGPAPGAVLLRSDVARKALFGVEARTRLPAAAYAPEVGARVYRRLLRRASAILASGHAAILDATFLAAEDRRAARALADRAGVPFTGLWLDAPDAVLAGRIAARQDDASDADIAVLRRQRAALDPPPDWERLDAAAPPEAVLCRALQAVPAQSLR